MANSKATAKSKGTRSSGQHDPGTDVSSDERQRMIAEAAYFRAMERGFTGGDPIEDWVVAEREISRALPSPKQQKEELTAYKKLREKVEKILAETRDTVSAETIRGAIDTARAETEKLGKHSAETLSKVTDSLKKDLASAAERMGPKWEAFSDKTADLFGIWRDRSSTFLAHAATATGEWLHQLGERWEHPLYRTGETAASGTFACAACGEQVTLQTHGHLPLCPKCHKMEFRRL